MLIEKEDNVEEEIIKKMKVGLEIGTGHKPQYQYVDYNILHTDIIKSEYTEMELDISKTLPFDDDSFDLVICHGTLEHLDDFYFAVNEMHRVLKNGGKLVLTLPHFASSQTHQCPDHKRVGHSNYFNEYTGYKHARKDLRYMSENRKFDLSLFKYTITFGTIVAPIINHTIGFKRYEYHFARVMPFNIDMMWFELIKDGFWGD